MLTNTLSKEEIQRYQRHLSLTEIGEEGQIKLKNAKVLVIGLGGLGSPAALYLAASGVGHIGLIDNDVVSIDNLQRQILYAPGDVSSPKADLAKARLNINNPCISVKAYREKINSFNALNIISEYDVILDCTDNFPAKYVINDACVMSGKPDVYGAIYKFDGQISVFNASSGPCYRCLYPNPPVQEIAPNCDETGVLGVLPGIIGTFQASEAIKIILGIGESLIGRMLLIDVLGLNFRFINLRKDTDCPLCGKKRKIHELIDYNIICENPNMRNVTEITVFELKDLIEANPEIQLIDVREEFEYAQGSIPQAKLIPLGQIVERMVELEEAKIIYLICRSGKRSASAIHQLMSAGYKGDMVNIIGGMLGWSNEIDGSISVQ
jgi:adenylyltransferase/sulfurtransferase